MKKLLALLLAVIMVLGLVACQQPDTEDTKDTTPSTTASKDDGTTAATTTSGVSVTFPLEEEVTLTLLCGGGSGATHCNDYQAVLAQNKLWQKLYEMTNVRVVVQTISGVETLSAMMQSGSYGDMIGVNGTSGMNDTVTSELIATGKLLPLEDYFNNPNVMPNWNKYVKSELPEAQGTFTSPDGHLYIAGFYNSERSGYLESSCWINKTWLEDAGMTVEDVATLEGLEEFFAWIMENDPNGNNEQDELPYACLGMGGSMIEAMLGMWGVPTKDGVNENYVVINDGVVEFVPQMDAYKDFLATMNKWFENGWMWQDYFVAASDSDYWSQLHEPYMKNNGNPDRVGFFTGTGAPARVTATGEDDMHPDPENKCEYISILPPKVEGYETRWYMHPGFMGTKGAMCVAANTKYPEICAAWIDLFYNEDISLEKMYGAEDSKWRVVAEDGTISQANPESSTQIEWINSGDTILNQLINCLPNAITKNLNENVLTVTPAVQAKREALAFYEDAGVLNTEIWPRPYIDTDDATELSEIRADIFTLVNTYRADVIHGVKDLDSTWEDFQDQLANDVETERLVEIMQTAYDTWLAGQGE